MVRRRPEAVNGVRSAAACIGAAGLLRSKSMGLAGPLQGGRRESLPHADACRRRPLRRRRGSGRRHRFDRGGRQACPEQRRRGGGPHRLLEQPHRAVAHLDRAAGWVGPEGTDHRSRRPARCGPVLEPRRQGDPVCLDARRPTGVWRMAADGAKPERICDGDQAEWSPDGKRIALRRNEQLFVRDLATGEESRLTPADWPHCSGPAWSPDGKTIAFACRWDAGNALFLRSGRRRPARETFRQGPRLRAALVAGRPNNRLRDRDAHRALSEPTARTIASSRGSAGFNGTGGSAPTASRSSSARG